MAEIAGLVLAAGKGSRMGQPKATIMDIDGVPWLARAANLLKTAGANPVMLALGAEAERAVTFVPEWSHHIVVQAWREGIGASLRESLTSLDQLPDTVTAVVVTLVDLPSAHVAAANRLIGSSWTEADLRRATYEKRPGHPVLIGRSHWLPLANQLRGETGARAYLEAHGVVEIDCTDIGGGDDVDYFVEKQSRESEPPSTS